MNRYRHHTNLWSSRRITLEADGDGNLAIVIGQHDGIRAPITAVEAHELAEALNKATRPQRRLDRLLSRFMRQTAGDNSTQIQIGNWPAQR